MEEVEAANRAAVETCHRVLNLLSQSQEQVLAYRTLVSETAEAVSKFKRVVSLLGDGVGHARVRRLKRLQSPLNHKPLPQSSLLSPTFSSSKPFPRNLLDTNPAPQNNSRDSLVLKLNSASRSSLQLGPPAPSTHFQSLQQQQGNQTLQLQQQIGLEAEMLRGSNSGFNLKFDNSSCTATGSSARSSFMSSSLSMDGSVASLDGGRPFHLVGASRSSDNGAPLPPLRRRCSGRGDDGSSKCASRGRCHCSRRRKLRVKRSIRVPAISNRVADIPPDDYSWRKYGQKPIKGSPHPRGYYKCSSMRGCPARKHVERCLEDPSMLTITYEGEHSHTRLLTQSSHA